MLAALLLAASANPPRTVEVTAAPGVRGLASGRVVVVFDRRTSGEPRDQIGGTGMDKAPIFGADGLGLADGKTVTLDARSTAFPIASMADLNPGTYRVQAVLLRNRMDRRPEAGGNLFSPLVEAKVEAGKPFRVKLRFESQIPMPPLPKDTERVKYLELPSPLLSAFWKTPIKRRVAVVLPKGFGKDPGARYPLVVNIGGYGTPYTAAPWLVRDLDAPGVPPFIVLQLDGTGPYGDTNQVNSANNGPWGDSLTREVIPEVERRFQGIGSPQARFTTGGSTGGWVSFALQVFYPDFFNGCWSYFPDPVDFRDFQLTNIYADANHYRNPQGFERAGMRSIAGDTLYTARHEVQSENVLGDGGSYTTGGGQWSSWNATFGPRGNDGRPAPLWDPVSGKIDRSVAERWRSHDLRHVLETNWKTLGPRLRGKIHLAVGDADEYFLNNAVVRLEAFLSKADPPAEARIKYGWRAGHGYRDIDGPTMYREMAARVPK